MPGSRRRCNTLAGRPRSRFRNGRSDPVIQVPRHRVAADDGPAGYRRSVAVAGSRRHRRGTDAFGRSRPRFPLLATTRQPPTSAADLRVRPRIVASCSSSSKAPQHHAAVREVWARALAGEDVTRPRFQRSGPDRRATRCAPRLRNAGPADRAYPSCSTSPSESEREATPDGAALRMHRSWKAICAPGGLAHDLNNLLAAIPKPHVMFPPAADAAGDRRSLHPYRPSGDEKAAALTHRLLPSAPANARPQSSASIAGERA